jgi:cation diffusion facilitator family transporter
MHETLPVENPDEPQKLLRVGIASAALNVVLIAIQLVVAIASGSLAVAAEATHNMADLTASLAVIGGLLLSRRKAASFPYGLYKIENVVGVLIAATIFLAAYEIGREALSAARRPPEVEPWMILCVVVAGIAPLIFSRYELRIGQATRSPSVIADAREFQAHALSASTVLLALLGESTGLPLDRIGALVIIAMIGRLGWKTLVDAMRVLLDASLSSDTLARVEQVMLRVPGVIGVRDLVGRNSGRFRFLEATLILRATSLTDAQRIKNEVAQRVREAVPHVERILLDLAPRESTSIRIALPLQEAAGRLSDHFGTAPWFAFIEVGRERGEVERQLTERNPFAQDPRGRGLRVAEWLLENGADLVLTRDDIRERGPGHSLARAGVEIVVSSAAEIDDAVAEALALRGRTRGTPGS